MSVSSGCFTLEGKEKSRSDEVHECTVGQALLEDTGAILVSPNLTGFCLKGERACGGKAIWLLSDSSSWIYKQQWIYHKDHSALKWTSDAAYMIALTL